MDKKKNLAALEPVDAPAHLSGILPNRQFRVLDHGIMVDQPVAGIYLSGHDLPIRYRISSEVADDVSLTLSLRDKINSDFNVPVTSGLAGDARDIVELNWVLPLLIPPGIDYYILAQAGDQSGESDTFSINLATRRGSHGMWVTSPGYGGIHYNSETGILGVSIRYEEAPGVPLTAIRFYGSGSLLAWRTWPPDDPPPLTHGDLRTFEFFQLPLGLPEEDVYHLRVTAGDFFAVSGPFHLGQGLGIPIEPLAPDGAIKGHNYGVRWDRPEGHDIGTPTISLVRFNVNSEQMHHIRSYADDTLYTVRTAAGWEWSWKVPYDVEAGYNYHIKIESEDGTRWGYSPSFRVSDGPRIDVRTDWSGEDLYKTEDLPIRWTMRSSEEPVARLLLCSGGICGLQIVEGLRSNSHNGEFWHFRYRWNVGEVVVERNGEPLEVPLEDHRGYSVRFEFEEGYGGGAEYIGPFGIWSPTIEVMLPAEGQVFEINSIVSIVWDSENLRGHIEIDVMQGSDEYFKITPDHMNSGRFDWRIFPSSDDVGSLDYPEDVSSGFRIRVRSLRCPHIEAFSGTFTISP